MTPRDNGFGGGDGHIRNIDDYCVNTLLNCSDHMTYPVGVSTSLLQKQYLDEIHPWKPEATTFRYRSSTQKKKRTKKNERNTADSNSKYKKKITQSIKDLVHLSQAQTKINQNVVLIKPPSSVLFPPTPTNKLLKSFNVLSYSSPSWRFILQPKTFFYMERHHPSEVIEVLKLSPRSKSSCKANGIPRILDPALFFDERLAAAYKALNLFEPNQAVRKYLNETENNLTKIDTQDRLYSTSFINIPISFNCEDECNHKDTKKTSRLNKGSKKIINFLEDNAKHRTKKKTSQKKKRMRRKKSTSSDNTCCTIPQKSKNTYPNVNSSFNQHTNTTISFLPRIGNGPSMLKSSGSNILLSGSDSTEPLHLTSKNVSSESVGLYLPTLSYGNYNRNLNIKKKQPIPIKLPSLNGIKVCFSTSIL